MPLTQGQEFPPFPKEDMCYGSVDSANPMVRLERFYDKTGRAIGPCRFGKATGPARLGYVSRALIDDFTPGTDVDRRLAGSLHLVVVDSGSQGLQTGGCPEIQVFVFHQG